MSGCLLVVGEALVEVMRPRLGIPLGVPDQFVGPFPSGAPAIAADAAARAGADVALFAAVGDDPFGRLLLRRLSEDGVDTSGVRVISDAVTGVAFVAYDAAGEREFVFHAAEAAPSHLSPQDLGAKSAEATWLHVSGSSLALSERLAETVLVTVERVLSAGGRISFDPNLRVGSAGASGAPPGFDRLLEVASLLLPSEGELDAFGTDAISLAEAGAVVCETLGKDGARVHQEGVVTEIAGIEVEEVDPTGAGDAFSGTFLAVYMHSGDPIAAARAANIAAAAHVRAQGPMESVSPPSGSGQRTTTQSSSRENRHTSQEVAEGAED